MKDCKVEQGSGKGSFGYRSFYSTGEQSTATQPQLQFTNVQTSLFQQPVQTPTPQPLQTKPDRIIYQPPTITQTASPSTVQPQLQLYVNMEVDDPLAGILTGRGVSQEFLMVNEYTQEHALLDTTETTDPLENPLFNMVSGKRDVETNEYCKTFMVNEQVDPLHDNCPWTAAHEQQRNNAASSSQDDRTPYISQTGLHMPGFRDESPTSPWSTYERSWQYPSSGYTYSSHSQYATPYMQQGNSTQPDL